MYFWFGVFLFICIVFLILGLHRRKCIIKKVCQMDTERKVELLNAVMESFGFAYQVKQDLVTSRVDAWQRKFGYRTLFDKTASGFNMVFDSEPVFFYYKNRTYRIEFWKGQYGINIGGEIGAYYADGRLKEEEFDTASFQSVSDEELLHLGITFFYKGQKVFEHAGKHWWLTGFSLGRYCEPEDTVMWAFVEFPNQEMLKSFVESLLNKGYRKCEISINDLTVSFLYARPFAKQARCTHRLRALWSQWKNRRFCSLFLWATKPFACTLDRILYLYFFLPVAFRHIFLWKRNRRQKCRKKKVKVRFRELQ